MMELREKRTNDPLWNWKKHSGFKKGLATDIVLGDEHHSLPNSTFQSDYGHKTLKAAIAAGKSFGTSDKSENHIIFGDEKILLNERQESVSNSDFKTQPYIAMGIIKPGAIKMSDAESKKKTVAQKYHSKAHTATASAHIGLQTRQDLPIDDQHFKNFVTTTQDAFTPIDLSLAKAQVSRNIGRPSHIRLGDSDKLSSYETEHGTSYVSHAGNSQAHTRHVQAAGTKPGRGNNGSSIVFGHIDQDSTTKLYEANDSMYVSTSMSSFPKLNSTRPMGLVHKGSGKSTIPFGELAESRRVTETSVTQQDYPKEDRALVAPIKGKAVGNSIGILTALGPDSVKRENLESMYNSTFKPLALSESANILPAGSRKVTVPGSYSSVTMGDAKKFDFDSFSTSTGESFKPHAMEPLNHPKLGAQMTKSRVQFGDGEAEGLMGDGFDRYTSMTRRSFVEYTPHQIQHSRGIKVKPHVSLHVGEDGTEAPSAYGMALNHTTHQSHFKFSGMPEKRVALKPHVAPRKMLFPFQPNTSAQFGTTSEEYYCMRDGLMDRVERVDKSNRESAIVFGDPKYTYFEVPRVRA